MFDEDVARRLGRIERRLRRVERALGLPRRTKPRQPPLPATEPGRPAARPTWADKLQAVTGDRTPPAPPVEVPAVATVGYAVPPTPVPPTPVPLAAARRASLEEAIGLKAAGWAGAVAVVAAVGWAIRWAYANGYFAAVTPAVRVTLLAAVGGGLIAAGEWVYRRVNRLSATGPFGAGVAVLFVAAYAGHAYYSLYGQTAAFALMVAATLVGAAVARRGNLVSVAVLSLVGGGLAPWLLSTGTPGVVPFLAYLLALEVVAVAVAYLGGEPKWWAVRGLSLATTAGWAAAAVRQPAFAESAATPAFLLGFAGLFQAEVVASAFAAAVERRESDDAEWGGAAAFSLLVTAGMVVGLLALFAASGVPVRVAWVTGTAAVAAVAAAGAARAGRSRPVRILGVGFAVQAAALLVVAVPVAVGGVWIAVGWAGLAVAYAVVGRSAKSAVADGAAAAIWVLAVGDLVLWTTGRFGTSHAADVAVSLLGTPVPTYAAMAVALSFVGHVIARLVRTPGRTGDRAAPGAMLSAAAAVVFAVAAVTALGPVPATVALLAYAWLTAVVGRAGGGAWLVPQAVGVLVVAAGKWAFFDTLVDHAWPAGPIDPAAVVGVGLAGSVAVAYAVRRGWSTATDRAADRLYAAAGLTVAGLLAWAASVEVGPAATALVPTGTGSSHAEWAFSGGVVAWAAAMAGYLAVTAWPARADGRRRAVALSAVAAVPALLAVVYVGLDDVLVAFAGGGAAPLPVVSPRGVAAASVLAVLVFQRAVAGRVGGVAAWVARLPVAAGVGLALVAGSFEVDRAVGWLGLSGLAEQVGLSVFWAAFAVAAIAAGFGLRTPGLRYVGLTLFAVTLLKVLVVDEGRVGSGGRVLSFLGVGLLLLGTSVLYGRVARGEESSRTSNAEH